jgi:single-strand DNA-binding protein
MVSMNSFNQCVFVGNVGRNPEIRTTDDGMQVANFSLAVSTWNREEKAKGEPIWLRIVTFGKLAENVEKIVTKGSLVLVSGRLSVREYTNKQGVEKTAIELIAEHVEQMATNMQKTTAGEKASHEEELDGHASATSEVAQPDMVQTG